MQTSSENPSAAIDREGGTDGPQSIDLMPEGERRRMLSSSRLHIALTTFVTGLVLALAVLTTLLISHIFGQLNPTIRQDLAWKTERAALDIVHSADVGILLGDAALVRQTFERYRADRDISAIQVSALDGTVIAGLGEMPLSILTILAQPANRVGVADGNFFAWSEAVVEGRPVGRAVVLVSTDRLKAGAGLKKRVMLTLGIGCVVGILLSLFFVRFYIVPLIRLTQGAFERLRETALAMVAKQRLERELEIGERIQTCILPKQVLIPGLEIAAHMRPATEVGGDYYDIIPTADGCWVGIGDVAGHGFTSGLVMLMAQSAVSALANRPGAQSPREILCDANRLLHANIRHRLGKDEFVTMSLLRIYRDGRVRFAGAHEDMIVCRADRGRCEVMETQGMWLGISPDIAEKTQERGLELRNDDVIVLYTDGVTEAMDQSKQQFGLPRLVELVERHAGLPVETMLKKILQVVEEWTDVQQDDVTLLVIRYQAVPADPGPHA